MCDVISRYLVRANLASNLLEEYDGIRTWNLGLEERQNDLLWALYLIACLSLTFSVCLVGSSTDVLRSDQHPGGLLPRWGRGQHGALQAVWRRHRQVHRQRRREAQYAGGLSEVEEGISWGSRAARKWFTERV